MSNVNITENILNITNYNYTVCEQIELAINTIYSTKNIIVDQIYTSGIILPSIVILISVPIALFGARIINFVAIVSAMGSAFLIGFSFVKSSENISCDARLLISSGLAILAAFATMCMCKLSIFIIGAAAFGSVGHLVFVSLPPDTFGTNMPIILENPLPYWIVILVAGVSGGLLVRYKRKIFLEACTAFIGACGVAYGIHGISISTGINTPRWAIAVIGGVFSIVGFLFQYKMRTKKCKWNKKKDDITNQIQPTISRL